MRIAQLAVVALALLSLQTHAQWATDTVNRTGRWETTLGLYGTGEDGTTGPQKSSLDIFRGYGVGFSVGYNFTQNLAMRFDGTWSRADYDAVLNTEDEGIKIISHRLSNFTGQFNGVWNILDGPFTPYLQAGVGWTYLNSNVARGAPSTGCWWDPWWGYVCQNFYSTYRDTNFSFNVGAGLRYEFRRDMFVRGGWERVMIDGREGADPTLDNLRIEVGWLF